MLWSVMVPALEYSPQIIGGELQVYLGGFNATMAESLFNEVDIAGSYQEIKREGVA